MPFENRKIHFRGSFHFIIVTFLKKYHPSRNLIFNNLGIFQRLKLRTSVEKIPPISLKLNFTSNTLGSFGLKRCLDGKVQSGTRGGKTVPPWGFRVAQLHDLFSRNASRLRSPLRRQPRLSRSRHTPVEPFNIWEAPTLPKQSRALLAAVVGGGEGGTEGKLVTGPDIDSSQVHRLPPYRPPPNSFSRLQAVYEPAFNHP